MNPTSSDPGPDRTPDPAALGARGEDHADAAFERTKMTYEGHRLPVFVILIWIGFFAFGLAYFVKHLT